MLKSRRSSWPLCLRARSLTSTSLGVMLCTWRPTISLWKKSLRRAFAMLRQGFSGCYCGFNATISRPSTRKVPSCSALDPVCAELRQVILEGWPGNVHECDPVLRPFFQFRDALIVQGNLVFRGPRLFVPSTLRKEFMSLAHSSHIGLGGCLC